MKKLLLLAIILIPTALATTSCESCVRKATKKATELTLSAVEGVSEAISERGEETSKKATDALGKVAKGSLTSIGELLDEHAESVAEAAGRTLVQTVEGLDKGITKEFYAPVPYTDELVSGVAVDYFGKIDSKPVVDAYFIVTENAEYDASFLYCDASGNVLFKNETVFSRVSSDSKYIVVSYALNSDEEAKFAQVSNVKIKVAKK